MWLIAALCNRSPEKLLNKAAQFHVPEDRLYSSLEEMLEQTDIDIVDIIMGPETHLPFVKVAAADLIHLSVPAKYFVKGIMLGSLKG